MPEKVYSLTEVQMKKVSDKTDDLAPLIKKCNDISQCVEQIRAYADVALHRDVLL
jgi:hypothetical protein